MRTLARAHWAAIRVCARARVRSHMRARVFACVRSIGRSRVCEAVSGRRLRTDIYMDIYMHIFMDICMQVCSKRHCNSIIAAFR